MRILIGSLFLPKFCATNAGSRTVAEVIKELSKSHEIYLATRVEKIELGGINEVGRYCKKMYLFPYGKILNRNLIAKLRIIISYLSFSLKLNRLAASEKFNLILVEWVESGILLKKGKVPMILDAHDVITKKTEQEFKKSSKVNRFVRGIKFLIVRIFEKHIMKKFDKIYIRSEFDMDYLLSMNMQSNIEILPHPAGMDFKETNYKREKNTIMFLGSYKDHPSNVESVLYFYQSILPLIRKELPDVRFYVVGYGPTDELQRTMKSDKNVIITGYVDDIENYYKKAKVFVAPMLTGGGIIVKILDAMAAGTPVVSTSIGNEGIGGIDNVHLLIADDPSVFANNVVRLLSDEKLWLRLSGESRIFVSEKFSMEKMRNTLNRIYDQLSTK